MRVRSDVVEWYEPPVEPGDDASEDEVEEEGSKSRRLGVLMLAFQVKCAKWDPPHKRDFAFVRCLKRPKRTASSAFSLLEVEKRARGDDQGVVEKLGTLGYGITARAAGSTRSPQWIRSYTAGR
mgnify:CR=1 FL=1